MSNSYILVDLALPLKVGVYIIYNNPSTSLFTGYCKSNFILESSPESVNVYSTLITSVFITVG